MIKSQFRNILFAAGTALSSTPISQNAEADPIVTVTHSDHVLKMSGAQKQRQVDCATLKKIDGQYFMTCEFGKQVDANNQDLCASNPSLKVADDPKTLSQVASLYISHFATPSHNECFKQAAIVDYKAKVEDGRKNGIDKTSEAREFINKKYPQWNQPGGDKCSFLDAYVQCKAEMN